MMTAEGSDLAAKAVSTVDVQRMPDPATDRQTPALRHRLRAFAGPLAAAALFAGSTVGPRLADTVTSNRLEGAKVVAAVAADRTASLWAGLFLMLGLALLVPFFAGITGAIRGRGATLATIGGTLAMTGAISGALSQWFFFSDFQLTAPGVPRAASVVGATTLAAPAGVLFLTFIGALTLGWALLVVAAWRSGAFARWHVGAFGLAWLALLVSHSLWSALVLAVPAIAMASTLATPPSQDGHRQEVA